MNAREYVPALDQPASEDWPTEAEDRYYYEELLTNAADELILRGFEVHGDYRDLDLLDKLNMTDVEHADDEFDEDFDPSVSYSENALDNDTSWHEVADYPDHQ